MRRKPHRRIASLVTALLFAVSMIAQGLVTTTANAKMVAAASDIAMSSGDPTMDCPGSGQDAADKDSCIAVCAGFIGILFEPAALPLVQSRSAAADDGIASLSDRSLPPDPYPPRPSALS